MPQTVTNLHFRVQNISRSRGRKAPAAAAYRSGSRISVVARAAYRSGESLYDRSADKVYDFRRKERVDHVDLYAHRHRPAWAVHRGDVWNNVEYTEKRKDARLAKDIAAALPRALTLEQHIALVEEFVHREFVSRGLIADIAIHNKQASDGKENPHVHIMITTRPITPEGFGPKDRELDKQAMLERWRKSYEEICNRYLEEAGSTQRVSLHSYKERGIDRAPGQHLGPEAAAMEERGEQTRLGDRNRRIRRDNKIREMREIWAPAQSEPAPKAPVEREPEPDLFALAHTQRSANPREAVAVGEKDLRSIAGSSGGDHSGSGNAGNDDAAYHRNAEIEAEMRKRSFAHAVASRSVQATIAFVTRIAQRARDHAGRFQHKEPSADQIFDRYRDLSALGRDQQQSRERDHERE